MLISYTSHNGVSVTTNFRRTLRYRGILAIWHLPFYSAPVSALPLHLPSLTSRTYSCLELFTPITESKNNKANVYMNVWLFIIHMYQSRFTKLCLRFLTSSINFLFKEPTEVWGWDSTLSSMSTWLDPIQGPESNFWSMKTPRFLWWGTWGMPSLQEHTLTLESR